MYDSAGQTLLSAQPNRVLIALSISCLMMGKDRIHYAGGRGQRRDKPAQERAGYRGDDGDARIDAVGALLHPLHALADELIDEGQQAGVLCEPLLDLLETREKDGQIFE